MTNKGKIFKAYAEEIVKRYGFGSKKMVANGDTKFLRDKYSKLDQIISWGRGNKEEALQEYKELAAAEKWLLDNGYLRQYESQTSRTNTMKVWTGSKFVPGYKVDVNTKRFIGLTEKGWDVAHKYLIITNTRDAEIEVKNQWILNNAGLDLEMDFAEYRSQYIAEGKPGWWALAL